MADEALDELVRQLDDESFPVRERATKALVDHELSIDEIRRLIESSDSPEVRRRLGQVLEARNLASGWAKLEQEEISANSEPCGHEDDGTDIYLVRTRVDGGDLVGKFIARWVGGNFPVGESEQQIGRFETWVGRGKWKAHKKENVGAIAVGLTKDGAVVYAARAKLNDGLHPGTFIEGEDSARIPWGGKVHRIKDFEVLSENLR